MPEDDKKEEPSSSSNSKEEEEPSDFEDLPPPIGKHYSFGTRREPPKEKKDQEVDREGD